MYRLTATAIAVAALAAPGLAQEAAPEAAPEAPAEGAATIQVAESDAFGEYLETAEGRPVYLFTTDTQGMADQEPAISCTSAECLDAWPLVTTVGDPEAGEGADDSLLATMDHEGETVVTYNGWPLYYFARDEGEDEPQGHEVESHGGEWYLVTAAGERVETE